MLAADELNVKSEEAVWECALRWVHHDPERRKQHIVTLMRSIRLGLLDTQFFLENVRHPPPSPAPPKGTHHCRRRLSSRR